MSTPNPDASSRTILFIAGEQSGDMQGALLLEQLRKLRPAWRFFGVGGDRMAVQGFERLVGVDDLAVIGFADILGKFFYFRRVFNRLLAELDSRKPDAVIPIDYPGFNLRFARRAKERGFPVLYYIAPQLWAWGEKRIEKIRRFVDLLVVLFPFELDYFQSRGIKTARVGHPLLDIVRPEQGRDDFRRAHNIDPTAKLVALMPGSRAGEVKRHLPVMLETIRLLRKDNQCVIPVICRAPGIPADLITDISTRANNMSSAVTTDVFSAVAAADCALVKSGTSTVECAMLGTPFVVMYKTGWLNYHIARHLIKTDHIAMVNLIAQKTVVPEFIQDDAIPVALSTALGRILNDQQYRESVIGQLHDIRKKLGPPGGAEQAARLVINWVENKQIDE